MDSKPKRFLDMWLNDRGYYRKIVASNETCLFRAVSDQIHNTEIYHEKVRQSCVQYVKEHRDLFEHLVKNLDEYVEKLEKHYVQCGNIEIMILGRKYERDFIVFDGINHRVSNVTKLGYEKFIYLCKLKDNHYDSVYLKSHIDNAGFCQSLVYKVLYGNVYKFENIDNVVKEMLYTEPTDSDVLNTSDVNEETSEKDKETDNNFNVLNFLPKEENLKTNATSDKSDKNEAEKNPPFPYKVAKALDPNLYRNITYDAWTQTRKDIRFQDWYFGDDNFKIGTKCLLLLDDMIYTCYIQSFDENNPNKCSVHVVELAEKRVIDISQLQREPDAKPWPLPYNVSKRNSLRSERQRNKTLVNDNNKRVATYENSLTEEELSENAVSLINTSNTSENSNIACTSVSDDDTEKLNNLNLSCNTEVATYCQPSLLGIPYDHFGGQRPNQVPQVLNTPYRFSSNPYVPAEFNIQYGFNCESQNFWQTSPPPLQGYLPGNICMNQETSISTHYQQNSAFNDYTYFRQIIKERYINHNVSVPKMEPIYYYPQMEPVFCSPSPPNYMLPSSTPNIPMAPYFDYPPLPESESSRPVPYYFNN